MEMFNDFEREHRKKRTRKQNIEVPEQNEIQETDQETIAPRPLTRRQRTQAKLRRIKPLPWYIITFVFIMSFVFICLSGEFAMTAYYPDDIGRNKNALTLDFVGDVMLDRGVKAEAEARGYDKIFSNMTGFWYDADLVFANLETSVLLGDVSEYNEGDKAIHFHSTYEGVEAAQRAGINAFACANNHSFDYGGKAVRELMDYFDSTNTVYSGVGATIEDAATYKIADCNGIKVAFISIATVYYRGDTDDTESAVVLAMSSSDYNTLVYQAAQEADVTVVYVHWGEENMSSPNKWQTRLGHQLIDAGADIVIGSHPHVLQEVEVYRNGIIFYSLGNFIFDQGNTYAKDSAMVEYTADENGNGAFRLYPVRIDNGTPCVTSNPFYRSRINRELTKKLKKDSYYKDENGFIVIPFDISLSD